MNQEPQRKIGIISDIHSNLSALETIVITLRRRGVKEYLCLGDIVGYGPEPNECLEFIQELPLLAIVAGNHDRAAIFPEEAENFSPDARQAIFWTGRELTPQNKEFLQQLKPVITWENFTLVHGSPRPNWYYRQYLHTKEELASVINDFFTPVCLFGHTHIQTLFWGRHNLDDKSRMFSSKITNNDGSENIHPGQIYSLNIQSHLPEAPIKYIINPGSVGQPRDNNPQAAAAIFYPENPAIEFIRLDYDIATTQRLIGQKRLPGLLANRLNFGQ